MILGPCYSESPCLVQLRPVHQSLTIKREVRPGVKRSPAMAVANLPMELYTDRLLD